MTWDLFLFLSGRLPLYPFFNDTRIDQKLPGAFPGLANFVRTKSDNLYLSVYSFLCHFL
jgi:hypothetical protein